MGKTKISGVGQIIIQSSQHDQGDLLLYYIVCILFGMKNDSLFQFDDILGQYKSTTFSPTHDTTHYNPTTTHQTGIFRLLLCKVLIS